MYATMSAEADRVAFAAGVDSCRPELARLRVELREARREIVEQRMEALHWESKLIDAEAALDEVQTPAEEVQAWAAQTMEEDAWLKQTRVEATPDAHDLQAEIEYLRKRLDRAESERSSAAEVERKAAVLYGDPVSWCRGSGMNRSYWRRKVRRAEGLR